MSPSATYAGAVLLGVLLVVSSAAPAQSQFRRARLGDRMERFTLADIDGKESGFEHRDGRMTIVAFLAAHQKRSDRALDDLVEIVSDLRRFDRPLDLLLIISGGEGVEFFRRKRAELSLDVPMLIDSKDELWGRLGVIVTPSVVLIDTEGRIRWIRAGHSFDFATETRARLSLALGIGTTPVGIEDEPPPDEESAADRAQRHLRMGQILARKGQIEAGIAEIRKAQELTPDAVGARLELAHLLCRVGRSEEALATVRTVLPGTRPEEARVKLLEGWAHRQLGDLELAERLLTESIALDPRSGRALFELGKVYERRGDCADAMEAYRRALAVHHDEPDSLPEIDEEAPGGDGTGEP